MEIKENLNKFTVNNTKPYFFNYDEAHLSVVPNEIIQHIWSFLPMDKRWAQLPLVCKRWRQIFESLPFIKLKKGDVNAKTP